MNKSTAVTVSGESKANQQMVLAKYIAHSGLCSRRKAQELVQQGVVTVNGVTQTTLSYRVKDDDVVAVNKTPIISDVEYEYILLNKPKDYITTMVDERNRRTVMDLLHGVHTRVKPVGRLDRNTTGLLILTNDGQLAQQLTHPKYEVQKVYQVTLDRSLAQADAQLCITGVPLQDGVIAVDELEIKTGGKEVVVALHSGKHHIVRRIFEYFDYRVKKLDRVAFAGLVKKGLAVGAWRRLTKQEVAQLKKNKLEN